MDERPWDIHENDDPDDNVVTRFRHLGGGYGPYDPMYHENDDDSDGLDGDLDFDINDMPQFKNYPDNHQDYYDEDGYLHRYDTWRFIPQWDFHMLGTSWRWSRARLDLDNPPAPIQPDHDMMRNAFKYCAKCDLSWLIGHSGAKEHKHPDHWAFSEEPGDIDVAINDLGIESSMVVHMSSATAGDKTGMGIYYGCNSKYNVSELVQSEDGAVSKSGAELKAAIRILETIKDQIMPQRKLFIKEHEEAKETVKPAIKITKKKSSKTGKSHKAKKTAPKKNINAKNGKAGESEIEMPTDAKDDAKEPEVNGSTKDNQSGGADKLETVKPTETDNSVESEKPKVGKQESDNPTQPESAESEPTEPSETPNKDDDEWESESDTGDSDLGDLMKEPDLGFNDFRIIIVTDCPEIVNNICTNQKKWKMGQNNTLRNKQGKAIKHSADYIRLEDMRYEFSKKGTQIKWYLVQKQFNVEARARATEALTKE